MRAAATAGMPTPHAPTVIWSITRRAYWPVWCQVIYM